MEAEQRNFWEAVRDLAAAALSKPHLGLSTAKDAQKVEALATEHLAALEQIPKASGFARRDPEETNGK